MPFYFIHIKALIMRHLVYSVNKSCLQICFTIIQLQISWRSNLQNKLLCKADFQIFDLDEQATDQRSDALSMKSRDFVFQLFAVLLCSQATFRIFPSFYNLLWLNKRCTCRKISFIACFAVFMPPIIKYSTRNIGT